MISSVILTNLPNQKSSLLQNKNQPPQNPISSNNPNHNPHPRPLKPCMIIKRLQHSRSPNLPYTRQITLIHTMIPTVRITRTIVNSVLKFIYHHPLEDISLVVNIMEHIFPEYV